MHLDLYPDTAELRLHLRGDSLRGEAAVDAEADDERNAVLLDDAVAVAVLIARRSEECTCLLGVIGERCRGTVGRRWEKGTARGGHAALEVLCPDDVLVDAAHDRRTHGGVGETVEIHIELIDARLRRADEGEFVRCGNRLRILGIEVEGGVDLSALKCHGEGGRIGNLRVDYFVCAHRAVPVVLISRHDGGEVGLVGGKDERPRGDGRLIKIFRACDIEDDGVRITEVVHQCRIRFFRADGEDISLGCVLCSAQPCGTRIELRRALQGGGDLFGGHFFPIGEDDVILQRDAPVGRADVLGALCQPWLWAHLVIQPKQCLTDAAAQDVPPRPLLRWIHRAVRYVERSADTDDLFPVRCILCAAAEEGKGESDERECA